MKQCVLCKTDKPIAEFYELKPGRPRSYCKSCDAEKARIWLNANPERRKEIRRNYYKRNKEQIAVQQREYYLANRERINERERNRTRSNPTKYARIKRERVWGTFGGSYELFDLLLKKQNNRCDMCGCEFTVTSKPQFDHDHKTMKPRGLLCVRCNTNLPYVEDSEFVKNATLYLKKHSEAQDKEPTR